MDDYTEADLAPERLLKHIKNLQRQVDTLYDLIARIDKRVEEAEKQEQKVAA